MCTQYVLKAIEKFYLKYMNISLRLSNYNVKYINLYRQIK